MMNSVLGAKRKRGEEARRRREVGERSEKGEESVSKLTRVLQCCAKMG